MNQKKGRGKGLRGRRGLFQLCEWQEDIQQQQVFEVTRSNDGTWQGCVVSTWATRQQRANCYQGVPSAAPPSCDSSSSSSSSSREPPWTTLPPVLLPTPCYCLQLACATPPQAPTGLDFRGEHPHMHRTHFFHGRTFQLPNTSQLSVRARHACELQNHSTHNKHIQCPVPPTSPFPCPPPSPTSGCCEPGC